jgi:predicted dehydrogenase
MGDKLRLAFVGAGFMGQAVHLPNFLALEEVEPVALAEGRPRLARLVADYFHLPRVVASHVDLAAMEDVDAVVAIMSEVLHPRVAMDLLAAGKHVFIEKPLAPSAEVGEAMVRASQRAGRLLMVGYMKRYDAGVQRARQIFKQLMSSGQLGRLTMVRVHCFAGEWTCGLQPRWRTDEPPLALESAPGPAWLPPAWQPSFRSFVNVYCHNLNLLRFFLGDKVEVLSAHWQGNTKVATLRCGETLVSLAAGVLSAHAWDEEMVFYFEDGVLQVLTPPPLLRNVSARVILYRAGKQQEIVEPLGPWSWAFYNEARAFVECCLRGAECLSRAEDAWEDLQLAERIARRALAEQCG